MPLTLTLSEGVLPTGTEKQAFTRLSEAMLKWHGHTGNPVMTPNVMPVSRRKRCVVSVFMTSMKPSSSVSCH
jgi:hypothetical protein